MLEKLKLDDEFHHLLAFIYYDKSNGYFRVHKGSTKKYLHRIIMNAAKGQIVDHINMNKLDNRLVNLRFASKSLNNYNRSVTNQLGRGVYFDKSGNRFRACISQNGKTLKLGSFKTALEAKIAYNKKSSEIYGADGYLHVIPHFELIPA